MSVTESLFLSRKKNHRRKKICAAPSTLGKAGILGVASWWSEQPSLGPLATQFVLNVVSISVSVSPAAEWADNVIFA